jgi:hypothetical protein
VRTFKRDFVIEALDQDALGIDAWKTAYELNEDSECVLPRWLLLALFESASRRRRRARRAA